MNTVRHDTINTHGRATPCLSSVSSVPSGEHGPKKKKTQRDSTTRVRLGSDDENQNEKKNKSNKTCQPLWMRPSPVRICSRARPPARGTRKLVHIEQCSAAQRSAACGSWSGRGRCRCRGGGGGKEDVVMVMRSSRQRPSKSHPSWDPRCLGSAGTCCCCCRAQGVGWV